MSSPEYRKQYIAQKVLLVSKTGHFLLLKSSQPNGDGFVWDLPGGQMEPDESPRETLNREVMEEIGVDISQFDVQLFHVLTAKGFGSMATDRIVKNIFTAKLQEEIHPILSHEHGAFFWVHPSALDIEGVDGFTREAIDRYLELFPVPVADKRIKGFQGYGLVQLIHGHGKGKTTAALGQAMRAAGAGKRVAIIYFDKGGSDHYFEREALQNVENIDYWATGRDRIHPETGVFDFSITKKDKEEAERGLLLAQDALWEDSKYDLVILDEINSTVDLGMLDLQSVLELVKNKQSTKEVILTGRDPHDALIQEAHLVTEMKLARHYFYSGVKARKGLDF